MTSCHESASTPSEPTPEQREVLNTITGTLLGSDGTFLAGQTVKVKNVATGEEKTAVVNADGSFVIDQLKSGSYVFTVTGNANYVDYSRTIEIGNGSTADIQVLNVVMTKKAEQVENIDLSEGTSGTGEETESGTVLDKNDQDVNADDSKVGVNISVAGGTIATDPSAGSITDDQIVVTPFYDESAAETRATQKIAALYYGLYIHFASGREIRNVTLNNPITISFNVDGSLVNFMKVKMFDFNTGSFTDLTEGVTKDATTGTITISTKKLGYFGLYFDVTENSSVASEGLAIKNPTVNGPATNPVLNYNYKVGAQTTAVSGSAVAKAFLKNWIVRQYGRSTITTKTDGKYTANVTLPNDNWSLYATGKQELINCTYTALGANFNVKTYQGISINYTITERRTHSGGIVTD